MHVTIVGAGALGRVYGIKLRAHGADVSFVVRPSREHETEPMAIEQVNGHKTRDEVDRPERVLAIPPHTDAILVAVPYHQLPSIRDLVARGPKAPLVVLTPDLGRATTLFGRNASPAVPGISGYIDERGVVRYWLTSVASTLFDDLPVDSRATLEELSRRLAKAGLVARVEHDVARLNTGTTIAFFPLVASVAVRDGIDGVLGDKELLATVLEASKESDHLARRVGTVASWAGILTRFVGPFTLKPGIALAKRLAPEAVRFVETHFGPKLREQHLAMGEAILGIAREQGVSMPSLEKLMEALRERSV